MNDDQFFEALSDVPNLRSSEFVDIEMVQTAKGYKFDGIAAPVAVRADLGDFTEEYERGSFRRFLSQCSDNIPFLHEHNTRDLLASTRSGRLRLSEEVRGLRTQADVVKTDLSERIKALVDSNDIGGMSIGMVVGRGNAKIERSADGRPHRRIQNLKKILDVCTTFDPAYATTEAQFRSLTMQYADSPETVQQLLMGAYPQLGERAPNPDGNDEEQAPQDTEPLDQAAGDEDESGVSEEQRSSLAARKRALEFLVLTTGGIEQ
jgi:HK97 family phage prohead protease